MDWASLSDTTTNSRRSAAVRIRGAEARSSRFVFFFLAVQIAVQLCVLVPGLGPVRTLSRIASFGVSLLMLFVLPQSKRHHPAGLPALLVIGVLAIAFFNPSGNTVQARAAQIAMNIAIIGPLYWVPRLNVDLPALRKILLVLWCFHASSSLVGVLQVYMPGTFQFSLSPVLAASESVEGYLDSLMITTPGGQRVYRPMGLTDIPGGAANSGYYTVILGIAFFLLGGPILARSAFALSMAVGLAAILLSQVRAVLVMLGLCLAVLFVLLMLQGQMRRVMTTAGAVVGLGIAGFVAAVALGGDAVTSRLATLSADDPSAVYKENRGQFLEATFQEFLPKYPWGAGLGRWGMMNNYFGDNSDPETEAMWVEIQWTGWVYDGGIPLILTYCSAIAMAALVAIKIAWRHPHDEIRLWASILIAFGVSIFALTFSYPVFLSASGMEYWLLNGALFTAAVMTVRPKSFIQGGASI